MYLVKFIILSCDAQRNLKKVYNEQMLYNNEVKNMRKM